jgi:hypothetical protein
MLRNYPRLDVIAEGGVEDAATCHEGLFSLAREPISTLRRLRGKERKLREDNAVANARLSGTSRIPGVPSLSDFARLIARQRQQATLDLPCIMFDTVLANLSVNDVHAGPRKIVRRDTRQNRPCGVNVGKDVIL